MIKSGKYLQAPSELAVEISKVFETRPTRKQVADYMSDKFGTDKNKPSSGDFIDTLDSVMNDIDFYYSDDGELTSSRKIASAKYDSDTSNLRAMKIPEDLPTWIFEKYVDETNQHGKEWVWYYFLEAIKHNPWKSGFTGDSLYATDGNIDIVVGPQQARCRLYKVTPKSQSMTELPYAAGGKKDDFYDWYIDKRYIDAFIKDVLHNYIWSRIKSSRKPIKSSIKSTLSHNEIFKQIEFYEQQIEYTKNLLNGEYNDVGRNERKLLERRLKDFKDGLARLNEFLNDEKDNLYKKVEFTPKEMKAIREEAKRINYKPGMENSLILALKKRNDGTAGSLYFKNREIWNKSGMAKDTDYGFDLIKKKIKSMNGNFDVDDDNDDVFQSRKAIKSAFSLSESERDGLSLVIGYITGIYGDDEDIAKYEAVRNSLSEDELKELENLLRYVIDAKQDVKVVKEANLKKDIPLLNKVYGILDENDLLDDSDAWYGFKKLESSRRPVKSERDKTFWNISNGYLTGNEVMKIMNEIDDWCAHRALTHSDIRGYSDNDVTPGEASDNIHEIITYLEDLNYRLDEYNMADDEDIQNGDFDDLLPMIDDTENLCKKLLTEETYSRMYNDIFKDLELVGNRDFELTNSRRPIKSGVENLDKIKEFEKRYAKIKGDVDKEEDLIQYYVGRYGIPEETLDEIAFNLRINSRRPVKSGLGKETVSVDVNSLYHFLTDSETAEVEGDFAIVRCDEDDGETYYDILSDGDLACMDGETCEIVGRGEGFVELHSIEANDGVNFKLSPEEFEVACGKSKKQIKSSLTSDSFEMMIDESRKMAEDMNSNMDDWWVTKQVGQDVVYFVAEHKDYSVRVRFEFVNSGFCYVSKTYTNGSYYEPVALESWKYESLSSQEIEGKMTAVLNDFFPKYNEIGSSKKPVESSVDYEPLTKLLDDLGAYPESRMPPAGIYKRLLDWKVGSEGMDEKEAREKFGTFTVGEWIDDLKESVM